MVPPFLSVRKKEGVCLLRVPSGDGMNRLTRSCVLALTQAVQKLSRQATPLVIAGNEKFFSAGADLNEIAALDGLSAYEFSLMGQELMRAIEQFPAPVYAAVRGYCMGGGLDLALACHHRIAASNSVFAHRGAALGLITGWGGTQRLPRLVGQARALEMFIVAEKINVHQALRIGLVDAIVEDPEQEGVRRIVSAQNYL
jgi:enoyl-CoA hydratase